ncbi:MAG: rRNA maturation RNase YbeY [Bdellovibrionia bacterium]
MTVTILNRTSRKIPRAFLLRWVKRAFKKLNVSSKTSLTLVFIAPREIRALNRAFRRKDRPTDVLSFESVEKGSLGELALCPSIVARNAREHGLSFNEELGYMVLHGILHLLGHEHERGGPAAKKMFRLQDQLFEDLCRLESGAK